MKKVIFFLSLLSCSLITLFGQNNSLDGYYPFQEDSFLSSMTIKDNQIIIKYENPPIDKEDEVYIFEVKHIYGMPFIKLDRNLPPEVSEWYSFEEYNSIQTSNMILFLSFKGKDNHIFAFTKGYPFTRAPLTFTRCTEWISQYLDCSSYLVEKNKTYSVKNLGSLVVDTPWVEGVKGDGIGEGFTFTRDSRPFQYLLIMNGYISYDKPYLYKYNNRVKKLKLTGLKNGKTQLVDILDTPHPQTIDLSFLEEGEDVRIEIADVYKGTKYDDTCLHCCINFDEPIIPYESTIPD